MISKEVSPEWLDKLHRDGYCVVPGVVAKEACAQFRSDALDWLEACNFGFDRNDRSTWTSDKIPPNAKGVFRYHGVPHESFMWAIRTSPGIRDAFSKVWNTDNLVVSFDALNVSLPINAEHRTDIEPVEAWPHIDQSPRQVDQLQLVQGIANLAPNGPEDGGLVVVARSHRLHPDFFNTTTGQNKLREPERYGHPFDLDDVKWYTDRGCEVVKVCGGEGDLLLWDSRTIHWNCSPVGTQTRFCQYVTYVPRDYMTEAEIEQKLLGFRARVSGGCQAHENPEIPDENLRGDPLTRPLHEPAETPLVLHAIGIRA